ncbi:N-acetylglucosaminyldiphosphodolichol N-acetylglucosaminyltransferase catalytic subunit alg13 [Coemansia sp. RSA 988]|nr:N-acetylglucosaminyldiphosphodolichol N-acetylglucosaminyltransferase catalytic subunit alg13 [Coemansia sp. RSA 988]
MAAYVTVGSTGFDELVRTVSTQEFLQALAGRGFNRLVVQCGNSVELFKPPPTVLETFGITMESFGYTSWPQRLVDQADLIICHAGTGSILEALHSGKPTIAVVNRGLANNHQSEVASELATFGYLVVAEPRNLASAITESMYTSLRPYPRADPRPIGEVIDEETLL